MTTKTATTTAADGVPRPAIRAVVDFDKSAKLFTRGLPTCDAAQLQSTTTEAALAACAKAKIGGGTGSTLLHAYGSSPVQTTLVLVGTVNGQRLDLAIPAIAGGFHLRGRRNPDRLLDPGLQADQVGRPRP